MCNHDAQHSCYWELGTHRPIILNYYIIIYFRILTAHCGTLQKFCSKSDELRALIFLIRLYTKLYLAADVTRLSSFFLTVQLDKFYLRQC